MSGKLKFTYVGEDLSPVDKLELEDRYALGIIESKNTRKSVDYMAYLAGSFLASMPFYPVVLPLVQMHTMPLYTKYPVPNFHRMGVDTSYELVVYLMMPGNTIEKLSFMWLLPHLLGDHPVFDLINLVYNETIKPTKAIDFIAPNTMLHSDKLRFGNSGRVMHAGLFTRAGLYNWQRDVDYVIFDEEADNFYLRRSFAKGRPHISGLSGMASMTCKLFAMLGVNPYSFLARDYADAMSAFIVGTGMHSLYEAYKVFNINLKCHEHLDPARWAVPYCLLSVEEGTVKEQSEPLTPLVV